MTEQERISYLVNALEGGNGRRFAERTGINPASLSKLRKGTFHIGRFADRICSAYPNVNKEWLMVGLGDSGVSIKSKTPEEYEREIERLNGIINSLMKELRQNQGVISRLLNDVVDNSVENL